MPRKHKKGSGAGEQPIREIKTVACNGLWCNGSTTDFGSVGQGSNPCSPTTQCLQTGVQASLTCADMPKPKL